LFGLCADCVHQHEKQPDKRSNFENLFFSMSTGVRALTLKAPQLGDFVVLYAAPDAMVGRYQAMKI
jgi:hypothetical protein